VSQDADSTATDGSLTAGHGGGILRLTLDRPSRRNSLNRKMIEEFVAAATSGPAPATSFGAHPTPRTA
jgi:2-(1,2-epoxy-1,2-dihydrophenyl)acetyl-CoA isomerase